MKMNIKFASSAMLKNNNQNHMLIELEPPVHKTKEERPNAWVFVVDKSSSMNTPINYNCFKSNYNYITCSSNTLTDYNAMFSETSTSKMELAKSSILHCLHQLNVKDKVGVVTFNSNAEIIEELVSLEKHKETLISKVYGMTASGCTNIDAGINLAKTLFSKKDLEEYNCKILIFSDGETNEGNTSTEALSKMTLDFLTQGITTSCLGFGQEYNSYLLNKMATSGGGYLYHIETLAKIEEVLKEELSLSNSILAKAVKVFVKLPKFVEIENNLNNYAEKLTDEEKEIFIGDITGKKKIVIGIKNTFCTEAFKLIVKCEYKTLNGEKCSIESEKIMPITEISDECKKDMEVIDYVMSLIKNNTMAESLLYAEKRDTVSINQSFFRSVNAVNNLSSNYDLDSSYTSCVLDGLSNSNSACTTFACSASTSDIKAKYSTVANESRTK